MISIFLNRIFRSIKIDPDVYDEVQKDKTATLSAAIVVVLSSLAAGIAAKQLGASSFIFAPILSLLSWFVYDKTIISIYLLFVTVIVLHLPT